MSVVRFTQKKYDTERARRGATRTTRRREREEEEEARDDEGRLIEERERGEDEREEDDGGNEGGGGEGNQGEDERKGLDVGWDDRSGVRLPGQALSSTNTNMTNSTTITREGKRPEVPRMWRRRRRPNTAAAVHAAPASGELVSGLCRRRLRAVSVPAAGTTTNHRSGVGTDNVRGGGDAAGGEGGVEEYAPLVLHDFLGESVLQGRIGARRCCPQEGRRPHGPDEGGGGSARISGRRCYFSWILGNAMQGGYGRKALTSTLAEVAAPDKVWRRAVLASALVSLEVGGGGGTALQGGNGRKVLTSSGGGGACSPG
jgi:hypothetical protein